MNVIRSGGNMIQLKKDKEVLQFKPVSRDDEHKAKGLLGRSIFGTNWDGLRAALNNNPYAYGASAIPTEDIEFEDVTHKRLDK